MKIFTTIILFFLTSLQIAFAGNVVLESEVRQDVKVGDEVLVNISLETSDTFYNAVQGVLEVDKNLEIRRVVTGNSIISSWIENPNNTKNNTIDFSGIIAGGFSGEGTIFSLVVVPKYPSRSRIVLDNLSIYLNDGKGTEEILSKKNILLYSRQFRPNEENIRIEVVDTKAPLSFEVFLVQDENIENGKHTLVFEAQDKESGIKTYHVIEGNKTFRDATSPYLLKNQQINEIIYVKAIDYGNNERIVQVTIPKTICFGIRCVKQHKVIFVLIFILLFSYIVWKNQSKKIKKSSLK